MKNKYLSRNMMALHLYSVKRKPTPQDLIVTLSCQHYSLEKKLKYLEWWLEWDSRVDRLIELCRMEVEGE